MLRALLTGWTAGSLAAGITHRALEEPDAAGTYRRWLRGGAERDMAELAARYAQLGAHGFG